MKTGDEIWRFCSRYSIEVTTSDEKQQIVPDKRFASLEEIKGQAFAIVNETEGKALFGSDAQNLGYEDYSTAFNDGNSGYLFKLEQSTVAGGYLLRLITPDNQEYNIWGKPGYLNAQPVETGWCCFILGLTKGNGEDMENGAVWNIDYVDGKGFSLKNVGTGKYLKDAGNANHDEPTYYSFCTLATITGILGVKSDEVNSEEVNSEKWFDLHGRQVTPLRPGLYIKNGRKFVISQ